MRDLGGTICPTLIVNERMSRFDHAGELRARPEMKYVPRATLDGWDPAKDIRFASAGGPSSERFAALREMVRLSMALVGALNAAGVRLLLGTDAQNPFVVPGFSVHDELAMLVEAGLTPYEALRAGTAAPAEFLGAPDESGAVAEGKRADLLLLNGNPLDDVAHARLPAGVMTRGRWLPAPRLRSMLAEVEAAFAAAGPASS